MNKFKNKVDVLLWAFIWLLPFFAFFVTYYRSGTATDLVAFINSSYSFDFVKDIVDDIWNTVFDGSTLPLSGYISYLVSVEIVHVMFDALVFIPRFAHELVERSVHLCERKW